MKHTLVLFLLIALLTYAKGQTVLQGRVTDPDGKGLELVNVATVGDAAMVGSVSDAKGYYRFTVMATDSLVVRFSLVGYETVEQRIALRKGGQQTLNCELKASSIQLSGVDIKEEKTRTTGFRQIEIQKLENTVGPNDGVESLLKTLPDVSSNNELSSQYSVRGGSFDENLVYINGVEVYRPTLVRSGQQEGLSIISPDMVDNILFSPGGFDATYGDKMSSALDITYRRPTAFKARLAASLLGGNAFMEGLIGKRLTYSVGFRSHSNRYLFRSLDTEGQYHTNYSDLQGVFNYRVSDALDVSLLTVWTRNIYGLVPESKTTGFSNFYESMELDVYFDGQEIDRYNTLLGALTVDWHPSDDFQLKWITSAQSSDESELYDIQSQYWLYELNMVGTADSTERFDRGVGTYLEHARNFLDTRIVATELKGTRYARLGNWNFGAQLRYEQVANKMKEWKWVDSADYSIPTTYDTPGDSNNAPSSPLLQYYCKASNHVEVMRLNLYGQRELNFTTRRESVVQLLIGARAQHYSIAFGENYPAQRAFMLSPRLSASYKPEWHHDMLFRLATGLYQQPPAYREFRYHDGSLNPHIKPQQAYQLTGTFDWNFRAWDKPFKLTADLYYKYLTNLIPYTIDNLRIRYDAENSAVGYATGLSLRLNGDFVEGLESWASLSLMKTQEDIQGDGLGWIDRPTDQRFSFKVFLQDYVPDMPWWRMSLTLIYGSRVPTTFPYQDDRSLDLRLPSYFRVDWGNTLRLSRMEALRHAALFRKVDDVMLGIEVFNLFNYHNVVSYIWIADYSNTYYAVPNYLTARQLNVKLTVTF